ncbi:MAG: histidine phosphatase family protein [Rhizobiales bacterium]|nr:histidine phosphatase family protein [Hyphomicrobiales bacterium]
MSHRLILMRHAKSAWPEGVSDFDRPLAPRGETAAPLMGRWLGEQDFRPEVALVSSAVRTRATWAQVAPSLVGTPARFEAKIYNARASTLLELVRAQPVSTKAILMIGHNPGMQELAHGLADPEHSDTEALRRLARKYPTAGLAVLESESNLAEADMRSMRLVTFITPRFLGGVDED